MSDVEHIGGLEILDSRGRPTLKAVCTLAGGAAGSASVPSGASTGRAEAVELRDGDPRRFGGYGCRKAVKQVREVLHPALAGRRFGDQVELDEALIDLDGTSDKSNLGANAMLAVSIAFSRAQAAERGSALFRHLRTILGKELASHSLPRPFINLFSGGKHAGQQVPLQDVLLVPATATTMADALEITYSVYQAAARLASERYGMRLLRADEGGLAPPFRSATDMLQMTVDAVHEAGLVPGEDVMLALDVAASHFFREGRYYLGDDPVDGEAMIAQIAEWVDHFPIVSVEDGLAEDDWDHWAGLTASMGMAIDIVGDDLLCTNPDRIRRAVRSESATALLLKVNQIGTLTEAAAACALARDAGWSVTISARSGETEDDWLADLAVGWDADHIKVGSITQSERLAKYNRLLEIEACEGLRLRPLNHSTIA